MNRVFLSGYWATNFGDDLFVKIICERYKQLEFSLETTKRHAKVYKQINNLRIYNKRENMLVYMKNKLIGNIKNTTNYFRLSSDIPVYIELGGSIYMLPKNVNDKRALKKRKSIRKVARKYFVMGSNFGPYFYEEQKEEYASFFKTLDGIVFREKDSVWLFNDAPNIEYGADIVFNLDTDYLVNTQSDKVIISVMNLHGKVQAEKIIHYEEYIFKSIIGLIDDGLRIILMSFSEQQGDLIVAKRIFEKLPTKYRKYVSLFNHKNIEESLEVMSCAGAVIATRFHAMILGWILKKPTYVIAYSPKTVNVIKDIFPEQNYIETMMISNSKEPISRGDFSIIPDDVLEKAKKSSENQFKFLDNEMYKRGYYEKI